MGGKTIVGDICYDKDGNIVDIHPHKIMANPIMFGYRESLRDINSVDYKRLFGVDGSSKYISAVYFPRSDESVAYVVNRQDGQGSQNGSISCYYMSDMGYVKHSYEELYLDEGQNGNNYKYWGTSSILFEQSNTYYIVTWSYLRPPKIYEIYI
jgi:hypothetical protein